MEELKECLDDQKSPMTTKAASGQPCLPVLSALAPRAALCSGSRGELWSQSSDTGGVSPRGVSMAQVGNEPPEQSEVLAELGFLTCELSVGLEGGDLEEHTVGGPGSRAPGLTGHRLDLTPDVVASLGGHTPHAPPSPRTASAAPATPSRPVPTAMYCSVSLMSSSARLRGVAF